MNNWAYWEKELRFEKEDNRGGAVNVVATLQAGLSGIRIMARKIYLAVLQNAQTCSGIHPFSYLMGTKSYSLWVVRRGVKPTIQLHLVLRLRMVGCTYIHIHIHSPHMPT